MNEEKIKELGTLTNVNTDDLTKNKIKKNITLGYYYLIQFAFFVFSSLVGVVFGLYSRSIDTYPFAGFTQRYLYGSIILAVTHVGNIGLSIQLSRKKMLVKNNKNPIELSPIFIYPAIILNILLSTISLFTIHNLVHTGNFLTINALYSVFENKNFKLNKTRKIKVFI